MYIIKQSRKFKKDFKRVSTRKNFSEKHFIVVVATLQNGGNLSQKYKPHKLQGEFDGVMECHIQPDILLMYTINTDECVLHLLRIGSHSDLF